MSDVFPTDCFSLRLDYMTLLSSRLTPNLTYPRRSIGVAYNKGI